MTPDHLALGAIILFLLHEALQFGIITSAAKSLAAKIPAPPEIHTGHDNLDRALNSITTSARDVLVDFLTGPDLTDILTAVASGSPTQLESVLSKDIEKLIDATIAHLGPVVGPLVVQMFGDKLRDKISTIIHGLVPSIALDNHEIAVKAHEAAGVAQEIALTPKTVTPLPQASPGDGSPTVVVAPAT